MTRTTKVRNRLDGARYRDEGRQRQVEGELREGEDDLDEALEPKVEAAADIARSDAGQRADDGDQCDRGQCDRQRDAGADDAAGEDVAPELVGAEEVQRRAVGEADEVAVGRNRGRTACSPSRGRRADRPGVGEVGADQRLEGDRVEFVAFGDRNRPPAVKPPALAGDVPADAVGRREGGRRLVRIHRREEVGEERDDEKHRHQDEARACRGSTCGNGARPGRVALALGRDGGQAGVSLLLRRDGNGSRSRPRVPSGRRCSARGRAGPRWAEMVARGHRPTPWHRPIEDAVPEARPLMRRSPRGCAGRARRAAGRR